MLLLALDCSTSHGSVALGLRVVSEPPVIHEVLTFSAGRGQGGEMFAALGATMDFVRSFGEPLAGIVVGLGPGSYSGVRQAIAAATGLAAGTGATLWGVPSPLALAPVSEMGKVKMGDEEFARWTHAFHAVGDARRGTFYYTAVQAGTCLAGPELLADAAELSARLGAHPDWPVGVVESSLPGGLLSAANLALPSAERLLYAPPAARLPPPLEPIYLRPVSITLPKPRPAAVP